MAAINPYLTFWGNYFGMCAYKFAINWMVSFNPNTK